MNFKKIFIIFYVIVALTIYFLIAYLLYLLSLLIPQIRIIQEKWARAVGNKIIR